MIASFSIAGRLIGPDHPPYIVAELSGNHNGDLQRAFDILDMCKEVGADAVKLQTYRADTITINHDSPEFVIRGGSWDGRRLYDLYGEASTPWEWHDALFAHAAEIGLTAFSSPFDFTAVDLLRGLDAPAYKIASFEVIDLPLIRRAAACGRPMIMSTGMASPEEISEAVAAAREAGASAVALLHCISAYPAPYSDMNLRTIADLAARFGVVAGLSDHTLGITASVAAVALGACIIEKHVTLRRADGGPDAEFSLEPDELARLVSCARDAYAALGGVSYGREESERQSAGLRRSLYVVADIAENELLTERNVRSIRPGLGLPPKHLPEVLGRRAQRALSRGTPLSWDMLS